MSLALAYFTFHAAHLTYSALRMSRCEAPNADLVRGSSVELPRSSGRNYR